MIGQRVLGLWLIVGGLVLVAGVVAAAFGSAFGILPLPFRLVLLDERLPGVFRLHMAASALGLLLLPLVLATRRRPALHRPLGRAAAVAFGVGLVMALPSALASDAEPLARAGFLAQGLLALILMAVGLAGIARGRRDVHGPAMASLAAIVSGAVVLRLLVLGVVALGVPFEPSYTAIAWLAWLLPLGLLWGISGTRLVSRR